MGGPFSRWCEVTVPNLSEVFYEQAAGEAVHAVLTRLTILLLVKGEAPCCLMEVSV